MVPLTNVRLLEKAIELSGQSARSFGKYVLDVDERTVRRYLAGEREVRGPVRQLCRIIIADPSVILHLDMTLPTT